MVTRITQSKGTCRARLSELLPAGDEEMRLRLCERPDWDALSQWPPYPPPNDVFCFSFASLNDEERDSEYLRRLDDHSRLTLVVDHLDQKTIGYLAILKIDEATATVGTMSVRLHPDWCGCGIGTRMLRILTGLCSQAGFKALRLEVESSNLRARRCYEKAGFSLVGRDECRNDGESSQLLMQIRLDGH